MKHAPTYGTPEINQALRARTTTASPRRTVPEHGHTASRLHNERTLAHSKMAMGDKDRAATLVVGAIAGAVALTLFNKARSATKTSASSSTSGQQVSDSRWINLMSTSTTFLHTSALSRNTAVDYYVLLLYYTIRPSEMHATYIYTHNEQRRSLHIYVFVVYATFFMHVAGGEEGHLLCAAPLSLKRTSST